MPRRETRHDIERALAGQRRKQTFRLADFEHFAARLEQQFARLRGSLEPAEFARRRAEIDQAIDRMREQLKRRRPRDGGMAAPVEPPRGPRPLSGGAAAALEFGED